MEGLDGKVGAEHFMYFLPIPAYQYKEEEVEEEPNNVLGSNSVVNLVSKERFTF